jgi:chromosome partitioning protein
MGKQAEVVAICLQKGGATKSTLSGSLSHIISKMGYKVLVVDLDNQGNVSSLLLEKDTDDFYQRTLFDAMIIQKADDYIWKVNDNLHVIPADDHMARFPRWLHTKYKGNDNLVLKLTLEPLKSKYDYIIIDTPPALSEQTVNALSFADKIIIPYVPEEWCYRALGRFLTSAKIAQQRNNPNLKISGILPSKIDYRKSNHKAYLAEAREVYKGLVFDTEIKNMVEIERIASYGFTNNPELNKAIDPYKIFVEEFLQRGKI